MEKFWSMKIGKYLDKGEVGKGVRIWGMVMIFSFKFRFRNLGGNFMYLIC